VPEAGILAAMFAASLLPAGPPWLSSLATAVYWASILATIARLDASILRRPWLALVAVGYTATFAWNRGALLVPDYLFDTDTERYVREAVAHRIQVRHLGFPVQTFSYPAVGLSGLIVQSAVAGALLVATFDALVKRLGARVPARIAMGVLFGASLSTWTLSSVVESFVPSALLLALTLLGLVRWIDTPDRTNAVSVGLLLLAGAGISLENLYVLVPVAVGAIAARKPRDLLLMLGVPILGLALWIPLVSRAQGPGFYATWGDEGFSRPAGNVLENLEHFTAEYVQPARILSPRSHAETLWRVFVMSVRGEPGEEPSRYPARLTRRSFLDPGQLACAGLTLLLLVLSAPAIARRWRDAGAGERGLLAALAAVLLVRTPFLVVYAPTQSLLFALPSLLALDLLVGSGLRGKARWAAGALALLVLVTNAWVLADAQRGASNQESTSKAYETWSATA
jgi:hypothetical protein